MININFRMMGADCSFQKNVLYKISQSREVRFVEKHEKSSETVVLEYCLVNAQFGIFAHEYRSPSTVKEGCKSADILACVVDMKEKSITSTIIDVKSNISAFSDDLLKDNAMLTAIKEIRDFVEQIHAEILHKNSFMLYYKDDGYEEHERIGIVTKRFEREKFLAVAEMLERLFREEKPEIPELVAFKLKRNLLPYRKEIPRIRDFADKKVRISDKSYPLSVILLKETDDSQYVVSIQIRSKQQENSEK